jgi:hypothetical protein
MVEENILGKKGFTRSGFFGGFIEQYIFINDDADIPCENKIRMGAKSMRPLSSVPVIKVFASATGSSSSNSFWVS